MSYSNMLTRLSHFIISTIWTFTRFEAEPSMAPTGLKHDVIPMEHANQWHSGVHVAFATTYMSEGRIPTQRWHDLVHQRLVAMEISTLRRISTVRPVHPVEGRPVVLDCLLLAHLLFGGAARGARHVLKEPKLVRLVSALRLVEQFPAQHPVVDGV
eukprot:CAMPEP_0177774014 /NCGR_PEP_ID=MMETSP0491_2-20121128/13239_1 /TAXON_ID=63592 /ORGANISM="Tetraselmis chuii, Strain PLY429" /LENGTH=155 /DNA_ID=CAMNT_0019292281 /DNA_START=64 /DNA_END=532 /DNA_ORIENTATION=+